MAGEKPVSSRTPCQAKKRARRFGLGGGFGGFGGGGGAPDGEQSGQNELDGVAGDLGAAQEELARQFDETGGFGP